MGTLLTIDDIRNRYKCGRDAAYRTMKVAGGKMIAGRMRIREERLNEYELGGPLQQKRPSPVAVHDYAAELMGQE